MRLGPRREERDQALKLSPHEQLVAAFGFFTLNPPSSVWWPEMLATTFIFAFFAIVWVKPSVRGPFTEKMFGPALYAAFRTVKNTFDPDGLCYTFYDYQAGAWQKGNGLRIDHLLLSPQAADRLAAVGIDKAERGKPEPSDHIPVWCELDLSS